jgi:hypothetical protein
MPRKIKYFLFQIILCFLVFPSIAPAAEGEKVRLLSLSESEKLILVSQIPSKKKFLLDASSVKITIAGKALEFKELKQYSVIQIKMELGKKTQNGKVLDGIATEIYIPGQESVR